MNAMEQAASLLSRRAYSVRELEKKLALKGFSPDEIQHAIQRFSEYLDDEQYAERRVVSLRAKGYGRGYIARDLSGRGIDKDLAELVLERLESLEDGTPVQKALRAVYKGKELDRKERGRVANALYRRGFDWDEINVALKALTDEY